MKYVEKSVFQVKAAPVTFIILLISAQSDVIVIMRLQRQLHSTRDNSLLIPDKFQGNLFSLLLNFQMRTSGNYQ